MTRNGKSPPAATGGAPNCHRRAASDGSENTNPSERTQGVTALPSKTTLARHFPALRINRYTGRWVDDATGARGDAIETLLSYIAGGEK
jgi:hypothetical protein